MKLTLPDFAYQVSYDEFGLVKSSSGSTASPFGFVGAEGYQTDSDSGLMLLGHRYYDPEIGRFLTRDPVKDGNNWYGYAGNNPLICIDPTGQWFWKALEWVGGIAVTVGGIAITVAGGIATAPVWAPVLVIGGIVVGVVGIVGRIHNQGIENFNAAHKRNAEINKAFADPVNAQLPSDGSDWTGPIRAPLRHTEGLVKHEAVSQVNSLAPSGGGISSGFYGILEKLGFFSKKGHK